MGKLKPCPFCGEIPEMCKRKNGLFEVRCVSADCGVYVYTEERLTRQLAMRSWNDRADEGVFRNIIETMRKAGNEGTAAPYWLILDPEQNMRRDVHDLASQITGVFFSRESAEKHLKDHRYNFSERAVVFCASGYYSNEYRDLWKMVEE